MDAQAGLHLCCSQTPKDMFFLVSRPIYLLAIDFKLMVETLLLGTLSVQRMLGETVWVCLFDLILYVH